MANYEIEPMIKWGREPAPIDPQLGRVGRDIAAAAQEAGGSVYGTMRPRVGIERYSSGIASKPNTQQYTPPRESTVFTTRSGPKA